MAVTKTFFLFHGDDNFTRDAEVSASRAKLLAGDNADLNLSEFEGETVSVPEILNAACSYPFLSDRRVVIVKGLVGHLTRKGAGDTGKRALEALMDALPTLPEWTRLLLVERNALPENSKLLKLAKDLPNGFERAFKTPDDLTGWLLKRAKDVYGAELQPAAASALAGVVSDLRVADAELLKLVSYADDRPVTEEDVALLTSYVADEDVFKMVDALAEGRGRDALGRMHRLLDQKDGDPFKTYGMIVRQFRLLLTAKEYLAGGGVPRNMASALGMKPFVADKLAKQSRAFSLTQLEKVYRALHEYDVKIKTGAMQPELALDLLVAGLGRSR
jgi:DNA polymerase-3 subunit delta